jgi:hypothetical protein
VKTFAPASLIILGVLALFVVSRFVVEPPPAAAHSRVERRSARTRDRFARDYDRGGSISTALAPPDVSEKRTHGAEQRDRVKSIQRDYAALRLEVLARYGADGEVFPGGSHTLMRQLALLEREKRVDLAAVLTPEELEELDWRESATGRRVEWRLGNTATEEQRRAVFRLQRAFDRQFADPVATDPAGEAARTREGARERTRARIHAVLGDELFLLWESGER